MSARPLVRLLAVLAPLALVLAACGSGSGGGPGASPGTGEQASPSASPAPSGTEAAGEGIEVAAVWTGAEQEAFQKVLEAFTKESGIPATYTPTGANVGAVLGPRATGGQAPDVAILPQPGLMKDFASDGFVYPVGDAVTKAVEEHYDEVWRQAATVDGELMGVFFKAANKSLVWYDTDTFEQAGVDPPKTWEELLQAGTTFTEFGVAPFAIGGAEGWTVTDLFENVYLELHGPEAYDQLARHEVPWDDPSVVSALEHLATLFEKEEWLAQGQDGALQMDFATSVQLPFREPPEAAMVVAGDFAAGVIGDSTPAKPGEAAQFFPFPAIEGDDDAVLVGGDMAVLMKDSEDGRKLLEFLATPAAAESWAKSGGFVSPNKDVELETYGDDISKQAAALIHEAEAVAFDLSDRQPSAFGARVGDGMYKLLQDLVDEPEAARSFAADLEREAQRAYEDSRASEDGGDG